MPATPANPPAAGLLEPVYVTSLPPAENSLAPPAGFAVKLGEETLAVQVDRPALALKEIFGYRHGGIND